MGFLDDFWQDTGDFFAGHEGPVRGGAPEGRLPLTGPIDALNPGPIKPYFGPSGGGLTLDQVRRRPPRSSLYSNEQLFVDPSFDRLVSQNRNIFDVSVPGANRTRRFNKAALSRKIGPFSEWSEQDFADLVEAYHPKFRRTSRTGENFRLPEEDNKRFRVRQRQGVEAARHVARQRASQIMGQLSGPRNFLAGTFNPTMSLQEQEYGDILKETRRARGIEAGSDTGAGSLGRYRVGLQQSLLGQAQNFGTLGEQIRRQQLREQVPLQVAYRTGAPIPGVGSQPLTPAPSGFADMIRGAGGVISTGVNAFGQMRFQNTLNQLRAQG